MLRNDGDTDNCATVEVLNSNQHLKVDNIMTDNAVFQHGVTNIVSGYTKPKAFVQIDFNGTTSSIIASDNGRFTVRLPAMKPAEKLELTVASNGEKCVFKNIAIGNVYLCAGQSNMGFKLKECVPGPEILTEKDYEGIRYFKVPVRTYYGRQTYLPGNWVAATKDNGPDFSGIAYFFARKMYQETKIPVGIIDASIGGVNIEAWLSRKSLFKIPEYRNEMLEYEKNVCTRDTHLKDKMLTLEQKLDMKINEMFPQDPEDCGEKLGFCNADFDDSAWDEMECPDSWTLAGHNHAGFFWYRKNIELPEGAENHKFTLSLGAVDKCDKTYVNGTMVGTTGSMRGLWAWNLKRIYELPAGTLKGGSNSIAVQITSLLSVCDDGGLIGPANEMFLKSEDGSIYIPLTGLWKYKETFDAGIEGMTCMRSFGQGCADSFHIFYDNLIYPMSGLQLNGVIWYQGEANTICMAHTYRSLLTGMINDWRDVFENDDLHFHIIQLPEMNPVHYFSPYSQWARLREAQQQSCNESNSDCIITLGFGDVINIHPVNKKDVSEMIAEKEIRRISGLPAFKAPQFESMTCENNALILKFTGDEIADGIDGFAVAGKDMQAYRAKAELIDRHTLRVYAPEVAAPYAVWYAWADNPSHHTLKSTTGEQASPFRASLDNPMPVGKNMI
ncbi:MAG: hypothetical protein IKB71_09220 [Lentisphaeria bacterium]|nr:hypothetical protein [Lentisphaeria bacterium]